MRRADVVVIGGGQAGLAMSRVLEGRGVPHAVLERGRVGERWRSERWDSLRLLTPRWQARLPGLRYDGPEPDGFMTRGEVVALLERYAAGARAPVEEGVEVRSVERWGGGFRIWTGEEAWAARAVVVATGHCQEARVPEWARALPPGITQVEPTRYRNPSRLPAGGVLVVGASATGVQLAAELHASGRPVTLAAGRHTRAPRRYRGRDLMWWYDAAGIADDRTSAVADVEAARRSPSLQLVGSPDHRTLDLAALERMGVRLAGRALGVLGGRVVFGRDLTRHAAEADARLGRLLARIDAFAAARGLDAPQADPPPPFRPGDGPEALDLAAEGIRTVLWATGYRRSYPWLHVPALDARGELVHEGGVTPVSGLYALGLPFLRRRKSAWLDGVGDDARELADHLLGALARRAA
ncbi:MAG: NAD(P)/FAD-dependent oxidoreductase [Anaeromyxobacter sp.]